ncbi:hypothetical protein HK102_002871 [Quaeritorhiza haematococci]|nr:hypothetical protein HK102_002871 [Quaeritorhiza haematococci]
MPAKSISASKQQQNGLSGTGNAAGTAAGAVPDSPSAANGTGNVNGVSGVNAGASAANSTNANSNMHGSIMICRNKHYPYIASYHGPWLSLPIELLQSLLSLNNDTSTSPPPPPIDPVIFKNLISIRRLIDDASELVIKAAGGGSSSSNPLGISLHPSNGYQSFGGNKVSHIRQHRLRELAVAKLAKAYRIDEIATSVLTMQSASALDDVAAKVLKRSPNHIDALYVHFFHEKIPSRMLAASTTTDALDRIITLNPTSAEYHRTRAMIRCFREEFALSLRDFKTAIQLSKKRKRNVNGVDCEALIHGGASSKRMSHMMNGGSGAGNGSGAGGSGRADGEDDCGAESQLYFLRAACFHQYAVSLIDQAIQKVNDLHAAERQKKSKKNKKKNKQANGTTGEPSKTTPTSTSPASSPSNTKLAPSTNTSTSSSTAFPSNTSDNSNPDKEHCSVTLTPSTAYHPADIAPAPLEKYRPELERYAVQIANLVRRSIRDYVRFLSYYSCNLPAFPHPNIPGNGSGSGGVSSSGSSSPPSSPVQDATPESTTDTTNQASTLPEFLQSIPHKALTLSSGSSSPSHGPIHHPNCKGDCGGASVRGNGTGKEVAKLNGSGGELVRSRVNGSGHMNNCTSTNGNLSLVPTSSSANNSEQIGSNALVQTGSQSCSHSGSPQPPQPLSTYHPLLVEAWYAIGLNYLILGDWPTSTLWHERISKMVEYAEGYPVFLPARSMSQADYVEVVRMLRKVVLERGGLSAEALAKKQTKKGTTTTTGKGAEGGVGEGAGKKTTASTSPPRSSTPVSNASTSSSSSPSQALVTTKDKDKEKEKDKDSGSSSGSSLRQYPLHTKRADTIMVWLQTMTMNGSAKATTMSTDASTPAATATPTTPTKTPLPSLAKENVPAAWNIVDNGTHASTYGPALAAEKTPRGEEAPILGLDTKGTTGKRRQSLATGAGVGIGTGVNGMMGVGVPTVV